MRRRPGGGRGAESGTAPQIAYHLETTAQPVTPRDPLWTRALPTSRRSVAEPSSPPPVEGEPLTVGDYFQAVRRFFEGAGRGAFVRACARCGAEASDASTMRIFLAKHGEFYHPARVEAEIRGKSLCWVLNVAASAAGRSLLVREHALLERLGREFPGAYLPDVYGAGEVDAGRGRALSMFLGQWLVGFHEFHLTRTAPREEPGLVLWDPENGPRRLDAAQSRAVYYQVARILTHYLNLETFEGITAWHHAAGDFVVRIDADAVEVRLISVRDYRPLFPARPEPADSPRAAASFLETLLIFLLNLSIRTRLDRLDGTGELAWAGPESVAATVEGVLDSLAAKPAPVELPLPMDQLFRRFLAACREEDLLALCQAIAARIDPAGSAGLPLMERCAEEHAATLAAAFNRL